MKYFKMTLFILSAALTVILVPSFALISSSQTNDTLSDDTLSDNTVSNDTDTFSSMSRENANESETDSDDESDQEPDD
jgi:hypothetical protein